MELILRALAWPSPLRDFLSQRRSLAGRDRKQSLRCGGCDHAAGQASFEAETHNQSPRREGARCRRTGSFAGGWCIRIRDAHCRYPAI
jgi:hypothetical protein